MSEKNLMLPQGLSKDTKERLRQHILAQERSDKDNNTSNTVTKDLCHLICDLREEGMKVNHILRYMPFSSPNTVYYHLRQECSHKYRSKLTYDECGWMRYYASKGAPSKTLAILYNVSQEVAMRHITGKCNHENMIEPLSGEELRSNGYNKTKLVTKICPICNETFEYPEYNDRTTCSDECNVKYASDMKKAKKVRSD